MNMQKVFLAMTLIAISLNGCSDKSTTTNIEGLWVSTAETSSLFEPGADKVALLIKKDSTKTMTARGFFLKNDELKEEWKFIKVQFQ